MYTFSFDEWADLYKKDPEEFERRRAEVLAEEISKAPVAHRNGLRLLQLQCDYLRETTDSLTASQRMLELALPRLDKLHTLMTELTEICEDLPRSL